MKTISLSLAISLEQFEEKAWEDMYQAAPQDFVQTFGLSYEKTPVGTFFFCSKIPFVHFNCNITLGLERPADNEAIDFMVKQYQQKSCLKAFAVVSPFAQPHTLQDELSKAGFGKGGSWDRIYRDAKSLKKPKATSRKFSVEEVDELSKNDWANFICKVYGLPTQSWLLALVGRKGWHHFILKENDKILEVRTIYINDGYAWIGVDAPIPGIMTNDFEADYFLMHAMVEKGLKEGVKHFVSDIEKPDDGKSSPAYAYFEELGFEVEYRRTIYSKNL